MNRNIITQADLDAARARAEREYDEAFEAGRQSYAEDLRKQGKVILERNDVKALIGMALDGKGGAFAPSVDAAQRAILEGSDGHA